MYTDKYYMITYINNKITLMSRQLTYTVADIAPSTEVELFNSTSLTVWSGASDTTIYGDAKINYMFRALHDNMHLLTGLNSLQSKK